mgnify:CR=1 FL=1
MHIQANLNRPLSGLLIGLVVFNLLAFGVFSYLRYRNRAAVS